MGRWQFGGLITLYVLVVSMAILVVVNRHHARQLFVEYQQLEKERDTLNASWSRLTLERSTRLSQVHVERRAKRELNMRKPSSDNIRIIRE
uniref:Cell division protein FtsL n=1 Tax=uncultured Thiotrichaceae bacterium TaxID=298394 RepID=A0A6S6UEC9_9GAMM|nr:MAG: Cell division protein FtsL [uncultured Thiotrichaceae bacterium]